VADGEPVPVHFEWWPSMAGAHTLTASVDPVPGEIGEDSGGRFDYTVHVVDALGNVLSYGNVRSIEVIVVADEDGDGVLDAVDNCPQRPNAEQMDVDEDGLGDACDFCPLVVSPGNTDDDGDGVGDECELQIRVFYPPAGNATCDTQCAQLDPGCVAVLGERLYVGKVGVHIGGVAADRVTFCDPEFAVFVRPPPSAAAGQSVTVTTREGTVTASETYGYAVPPCPGLRIDGLWKRRARVGDSVAVLGCGFTSSTRVYLKSAAATADIEAAPSTVSPDGRALVFVVPAGVRSGLIRVQNPTGTPAISSMVLEIAP
jgi:hypothetical protein